MKNKMNENTSYECKTILKKMNELCGDNPICKLNKIREYETCCLFNTLHNQKESRKKETEDEIIDNMSYT